MFPAGNVFFLVSEQVVTAMTLQTKSPLKVCHRLLRKKSSAVSKKRGSKKKKNIRYSNPHMCLNEDNFMMLPLGFRAFSARGRLNGEIAFKTS